MHRRGIVRVFEIQRVRHRAIRKRRKRRGRSDAVAENGRFGYGFRLDRQLRKRIAALADPAGAERHAERIEQRVLSHLYRFGRKLRELRGRDVLGNGLR